MPRDYQPIRIFLAGLLAASTIVGCQSAAKVEEPLVFFPSPPAQPRVQFLTWASGAAEIEPTHSSFEKFILGDDVRAQRTIIKPYGVAARDGVVYVCDTKAPCLSRLDFKNQTYSVLGARGPGRLRKPINVAIDSLGYKFVVDTVRKQVVVFGPADAYVGAFDVPEPCHPVDLAIWENELFVLDNDDTCQIVVMDRSTGEVLRTLGGPGAEAGKFKIPGSLAISPDGFLYVSDTHNWRIQKLTLEGEPVWMKGTAGYTLGRFGRPRGIRVGSDGTVYVVDGATELVQMFDADGNVLMRFGGPGNGAGALSLPSTLAIDSTSLPYFQEHIHKDFNAEYLLIVASQYGRRLINVFAFGSFPEGYEYVESQIVALPKVSMDEGIGPVEGKDAPSGAVQPEEPSQTEDPL